MKALSLLFLLCLAPFSALAHPMDFGTMDVRIQGDRLQVALRLHVLAAQRFIGRERLPGVGGIAELAPAFFSATLGRAAPSLGGEPCEWRTPELRFVDTERQFLLLESVAVCPQARTNLFGLDFPLPFLNGAPAAFQLVTRVEGRGEPVTLLASARKPEVELGPQNTRTFMGFLRLGAGHIGALPEEWRTNEGQFRFPEGLDHIFFVAALMVAGGSPVALLQSASGFTLGHSLTLALSTFKIIHVHSHWVEALIAMSIAYVAGMALFRPKAGHRWMVAALFGTVHGLGFASALQEIELSGGQLLPVLLGFNLGVELGQGVIIASLLPLLYGLRAISPGAYAWANRAAALALLLLGSYWFFRRAIN